MTTLPKVNTTMKNNKKTVLEREIERVALNPKRPILTKEEILEIVFAKSRLVLRLQAPENIHDFTEMKALRKKQTKKIEQFVQILEEYLVTDLNAVTIAVYASE